MGWREVIASAATAAIAWNDEGDLEVNADTLREKLDAMPAADRNTVGAMQHCSFTTTKTQFDVLHQRLQDEGVPIIGPIPVGAQTWSIYFFDPNGIRLEYSWQEDDGDDVHVVERWTQTRDEALAELRSVSDDPAWLQAVTAHLPLSR